MLKSWWKKLCESFLNQAKITKKHTQVARAQHFLKNIGAIFKKVSFLLFMGRVVEYFDHGP